MAVFPRPACSCTLISSSRGRTPSRGSHRPPPGFSPAACPSASVSAPCTLLRTLGRRTQAHTCSCRFWLAWCLCHPCLLLLHNAFIYLWACADDKNECTFEVEAEGRYCPNGYIGFNGACGGYFQDELSLNSGARWSPATNPAAPFSIVLISRPTNRGPGNWGADCRSWPQQTFFTTSRDKDDVEDQILWKTRDIVLYSSRTQHALNLTYGAEIPW